MSVNAVDYISNNVSKNSAYQYLVDLLRQSNDSEHIKQILQTLLTDKECQEICNRLHIFAQLKQGKTQREISANLGVGIATVSRGAKVFQQRDIDKIFPCLEKITTNS